MENKMKDPTAVKEQYIDGRNLKTRLSIHDKYSTNKLGFYPWIYQQLQWKENQRVLELGCGMGELWENRIQQLPSGTSLILSDFSEGMVEAIQERYSSCQGVSFEQINIEEIPYEAESFDIVIANMMLYHVPNLTKGLNEVERVLKKGGTFYCATFGENGIQHYLTDSLGRFGIHIDINGSFTLQNGADILGKHFPIVERTDYEDALWVTEIEDLINYIYSMSSVGNLGNVTREELLRCFEQKKDERGILQIPKEYGMFRCRKGGSDVSEY